jgi:hypothetical protein
MAFKTHRHCVADLNGDGVFDIAAANQQRQRERAAGQRQWHLRRRISVGGP